MTSGPVRTSGYAARPNKMFLKRELLKIEVKPEFLPAGRTLGEMIDDLLFLPRWLAGFE